MTSTPVNQPIFLDHHSTTPVDSRVAQVMLRAMTEAFGNPNNTQHRFGQDAAKLVLDAAYHVASLLGAEPEDVRFTSGSSEALRLALGYAEDRRTGSILKIAAPRIEHPALLDELSAGVHSGRFVVDWIEVDSSGRVDVEAIATATASGVDLVCMMAANNEVGVLQPIHEAASIAHATGSAILVDATQAAGRIPFDMRADGFDFVTISAHKMYGPKGVGALIGSGLGEAPPPSRFAYHNATPNVPGIAGLGEASRLRRLEMAHDEARIARLRDQFQALLIAGLPGLVINGDTEHRLAGNLHISIPGAPNDIVVANLRDQVALSTGAACVSGVDAPSHVLQAMKLESWRQENALRMGLGRETTLADIERAAEAIIDVAQQIQSLFKPAA
ncbi:cysteine desulfurase [Bosea sp. AK1]|uniref:cysteine desulfurase family protein n=1 Tax=Bosea sp. AK1 TaxID=2587160 RepID=UPI00116DEFB4|nr:cysteine desulfurase family protein [Bosea sp. AK1]TQI65215.1 cysteine desulfurase [Bosea sp. AK1]